MANSRNHNTALRGAKIFLYRKINCYVIPLYDLPHSNKKAYVKLVIICVEICLWRQCSFQNWATTGIISFSEWVDPYVLWNVDQPGHEFEAAEEASCDNQTCGMWVVSWQTPKDPPTLCCFGYRTDCYTIGYTRSTDFPKFISFGLQCVDITMYSIIFLTFPYVHCTHMIWSSFALYVIGCPLVIHFGWNLSTIICFYS